MLGIEQIASYLPATRASNMDLAEKFDLEADFIENKIGVLERCVKDADEDTSDMAVKALNALVTKSGLALDEIEAMVVVTQNPDYQLPHVSGQVHARAGLSETCATFDISLGCSGYVYGLKILHSFMHSMGMSKGVLITADPYTKIVDTDDKNTVLLFADAATATLIGTSPVYEADYFAFGSRGDLRRSLICEDGVLEMNGRDVFNFAVTQVPKVVQQTLAKAELALDDVDKFLFHQGSGYILEALTKRLKLDGEKVVNGLRMTGNTVSSSIPLLLEEYLGDSGPQRLLLCGFGVGLSLASCMCERKGKNDT